MDQELTNRGFNPSDSSILAHHQLHFWVILWEVTQKTQLEPDEIDLDSKPFGQEPESGEEKRKQHNQEETYKSALEITGF